MIESVRLRLSRPFGDTERQRAFVFSAVVVVALAGALAAISEQPSGEEASLPPAADPGAELIGAARPPAPAYAPPGAARVARLFLSGYLNHLYGRAAADEIQGASPALLARLSSRRIRVSAGMRGRRPRITGLETHPLNDACLITAEIADGEARFPVELILTERPAGWVVAQAVED